MGTVCFALGIWYFADKSARPQLSGKAPSNTPCTPWGRSASISAVPKGKCTGSREKASGCDRYSIKQINICFIQNQKHSNDLTQIRKKAELISLQSSYLLIQILKWLAAQIDFFYPSLKMACGKVFSSYSILFRIDNINSQTTPHLVHGIYNSGHIHMRFKMPG